MPSIHILLSYLYLLESIHSDRSYACVCTWKSGWSIWTSWGDFGYKCACFTMVVVRQGDSITTTVRRMEVFEGSGSRGSFSGFLRAEEEVFGLCAGSKLVVVELEIYETERWIEKKNPRLQTSSSPPPPRLALPRKKTSTICWSFSIRLCNPLAKTPKRSESEKNNNA